MLALALFLAAGPVPAEDARAVFPVAWDAPETLRLLYEKYLPSPPLEAKEDRGAIRRWIRDARRRAPEIAAAEGWFSAEVEFDEQPARLVAKVKPGDSIRVELMHDKA